MLIEEVYVCGVYFDVFVDSYSPGTSNYYNGEDGLQKGDDPEFTFTVDSAYIRDYNGKFVEIPDELYEYLINDTYIYNKLDELSYNKFLNYLDEGL